MVIMRAMELKAYLKTLPNEDARAEFAARCETSIGHLRNVCYGKTCGTDLAVLIWRESGGLVTREELRPDDYWRHWPDLQAPAETAAAEG